jgi:hypothetical protein
MMLSERITLIQDKKSRVYSYFVFVNLHFRFFMEIRRSLFNYYATNKKDFFSPLSLVIF